jgi:hypothetical protein
MDRVEVQRFEQDGGSRMYGEEELQKMMNEVSNGPLWEKAKDASREAFGRVKWPFVMWWYKKQGG